MKGLEWDFRVFSGVRRRRRETRPEDLRDGAGGGGGRGSGTGAGAAYW
jgi:hypothetical protein